MTRIVHISDLHFGYEHREMAESLLACVNRQQSDMVVITGDLTHRARPAQFADAAAFLSGIKAPILVVPGNHDIPLYNLASRFIQPWAGYRRSIEVTLAPIGQAGRVRVLGINSVDPFSWRRGVLRGASVRAATAQIDPAAMNIVAIHHPMLQAPDAPKELARNAGTALAMLEDAGVQVVLSGHLHQWEAKSLPGPGRSTRILHIHAGTALCARPEDPSNEFAVLDFGDDSTVIIRRYRAENRTYDPEDITDSSKFGLIDGYWQSLD